MDIFENWEAKRAGARITVRSKGEVMIGGVACPSERTITGILSIKPRDGQVIATSDSGTEYVLAVPAKVGV